MRNKDPSNAPRWMTLRRWALGLAAATGVLAACGGSDVKIDTSDYFLQESSAAVEQAADPEMNAHIGDMAEKTAHSVLNTLQAKNTQPRTALPDGLYHIELPDETFMISLELAGGPTDLSKKNLGKVQLTRFFADENGVTTTEGFEFAPSQRTGEWSIDINDGSRTLHLSPDMTEIDMEDGEVYGIGAAQADVDKMLALLEAA